MMGDIQAKIYISGEGNSGQKRQPGQEPCNIRMPDIFKALKKSGVAGTEFEGHGGVRNGSEQQG